jgi:hypothetical protein
MSLGKVFKGGQKVMARPRKLDTGVLLKIVDSYFESTGDPDKLKCSYLEEYAKSQGIDVKAYDFRRNVDVRRRMEELRDLYFVRSESGAIAYKSLDVDAFLSRCRTKTILRNSIIELDETWRRVYERSVDMSKKNTELKSTTEQAVAEQRRLASEIAELTDRAKRLNKENKDTTLENRYLRKMLKTYLYPAVANQILLDEKILDQVDTEVTKIAMDTLTDPTIPSPFTGAVAADRKMLTREESLFNRMREQIRKGN